MTTAVPPPRPRLAFAAAALLIGLHAALGLWCARRQSVTFDEFAHLPAGLAYWHERAFRIYDLSPPLPRLWAAAPLAISGRAAIPPAAPAVALAAGERHWAYGRAFMRSNFDDYPARFVAGRAMMTLLSCAGAAIAFAWARSLAGDAAGVAGCALYATDPNLVAHASLVGTDAPAAVALLAAGWLLERYRRQPTIGRAALASLALAAAPLVKFSLLPAWPLAAAVLLTLAWTGRLPRGRAWLPILLVPLFALVLCRVSYPGQRFGASLEQLHAVRSRPLAWLDSNGLGDLARLLPAPLVEGFDEQWVEAAGQFPGFLLGRTYLGAAWGYYPLVTLCKATLGLLALAVVAGVVAIRRRRATALLPASLALGYALAFTMGTQINIGSRYLLPAMPLAAVAIAATLWPARDDRPSGRALRAASTVLVALACVEGLSAVPTPLAFYNWGARAVGAPGRVVVDADWGQSLVALRDWMRSHGVDRVRLASFGYVDPAAYDIAFDDVDDPSSRAEWTAWADALATGAPTMIARAGGGSRRLTAPTDVLQRLREGRDDDRAGTFHLFRRPR